MAKYEKQNKHINTYKRTRPGPTHTKKTAKVRDHDKRVQGTESPTTAAARTMRGSHANG